MIQVELEHNYNFITTLDVHEDASDDVIRAAIEKLTMDDFRERDNFQHVTVIRDGSKDITGEIQPHTPNLNPS